jgi:hypothetical protein
MIFKSLLQLRQIQVTLSKRNVQNYKWLQGLHIADPSLGHLCSPGTPVLRQAAATGASGEETQSSYTILK